MPSSQQASKAELIERVAEVAVQRHGVTGEAVAAFLRDYYEDVAAEDLAGRDVADVYGAGAAHWRQAQRRRPGETLVEVYSPTVERDGWQSPHIVVEVVTDDMPFLVDSATMEISRHGLGMHLLVHPVISVERDPDGRLLTASAGAGEEREAFLHVEVTRIGPDAADALRRDLLRVLADVRAAVEDWKPMRQRAEEEVASLRRSPPPRAADEVAEAAALLQWLVDDQFIFLGCRRYVLDGDGLQPVPGTGLGLLRGDGDDGTPAARAAWADAAAREPALLVLTKANTRATVHRPTQLDYIGVKQYAEDGDVAGEHRFLGLYRTSAYTSLVTEIPVVRRKVASVLARAGFAEGSHSAKSLAEVLETLPRDELIQATEDELFATAVAVAGLQERQQVRLFCRLDRFGRFASLLVYLPRARLTATTGADVGGLLTDLVGGTTYELTPYLSDSVLVRLHYVVQLDPARPHVIDALELQERVADATRLWEEELATALVEACGEEEGARLHQRYAGAFPAGYRADFPARAAVADIRRIESLSDASPAVDALAMSLYHPLEAPDSLLRLKLIGSGPPVSLSTIVPVLEHMGARVADEHPYTAQPAAGPPAWIYDFGLLVDEGDRLNSEKVGAAFQDAVAHALRGEIESDGFNRLVLVAGLDWREVVVLRAVCKYLRQAGTNFSQTYMESTLARHQEIARQLIELFLVRFDPDGSRRGDRNEDAEQLAADIGRAIDAVDSLDEDRILRRYLQVLMAMVRTNWFQLDGDGRPKPALAFKLDTARIPDLPPPRPAFEIFVYSPRTEGVHLRAGQVARGGIRWSDRREDFRTEILGLMKAQTVKNAVIVPTGAKGGFVVKHPPAGGDRDALMAEGVACYRTFISSLLDVTDNLVHGRPVPPAAVVRHDGDDPYLVVAADKGTATLSDTANAIAVERGFWLGDAFASGGSTGYDHKKMGITARGAWESVRHHFRGLGIDVDTTEFSVVGIGDMSGDVFGNGMLLSPHIKLVAAFDHRHVFVDPDPDPARSRAERRRLFELPRSSWADYDPAAISAGGGVYPRTAKQVPISPQVAARLGLAGGGGAPAGPAAGPAPPSLTPAELISAILRAPVDLFWNGGIGTYVKASNETHADAGDRANDAVRVDARALRCRVVGEGGNLGLTQRARVEYALAGGLCNTDAIDNSAGVDCSDHEVNIKILLDRIVANGDLTVKQRNQLLAQMEDDVAELVLHDNREQNGALGNAAAEAAAMVGVHARYLRALEETGRLDRALEFLPTEEELDSRAAAGRGLVTPEFSVLLAYVKIVAYAELLASDVPDHPYFQGEAHTYFPPTIQARFADDIGRHPLRREIIATRLANDTVNFGGTSMLFRVGEETGAAIPDIVRAHVAARNVFDAGGLVAAIDAERASLSAATAVTMVLEVRKVAERATRWLLRHRRSPLDVEEVVARYREAVARLAPRLAQLASPADRRALAQASHGLVAAGVSDATAATVAGLEVAACLLDIVETAAHVQQPPETVAEVYFALDEHLGLDWLREQVNGLERTDRWKALARDALRDDLYHLQASLTELVLAAPAGAAPTTGPDDGGAPAGAGASPALDADEAVERWSAEHLTAINRVRNVLAEVRATARSDVATLCVAIRELRVLTAQPGTGEP